MTARLEEELQGRAKCPMPVLFPSATCPESFVSPWGRGVSGVRVENLAGRGGKGAREGSEEPRSCIIQLDLKAP